MKKSSPNSFLGLATATLLLLGMCAEASTLFKADIDVVASSTTTITINPRLTIGVATSTGTIATSGPSPFAESVFLLRQTPSGPLELSTDVLAEPGELSWTMVANNIAAQGTKISWPANLSTTYSGFINTATGTRSLKLFRQSETSYVNMLTTTSATLTTGTYSIVFGMENINNPPTANADMVTVLLGETIQITPLSNDFDQDDGNNANLTIASINTGLGSSTNTLESVLTTQGTISISADRKSITYTSTASYAVGDTFQYKAADNHGSLSQGWTGVDIRATGAYGTHTCSPTVIQGQELTVSMQLFYTGSHSSISVVENIPKQNGTVPFAYVEGSLSTTPATPAWIATTTGNLITFAPTSGMPSSGVTLSYRLSIDKDEPTWNPMTLTKSKIWLDGSEAATLPDATFTVVPPNHSADYLLSDGRTLGYDNKIGTKEINRVINFYKANGYHTDPAGIDGFATGPGPITSYHSADYLLSDGKTPGHDGMISTKEINRVINFYKANGYHTDPAGIDGFATGAPAP